MTQKPTPSSSSTPVATPATVSSGKKWPRENERLLLADACVPGRHPSSLWNFVRFAAGWHYRCVEKKKYWLTTREHKRLLDWLQTQIEEWFEARESGHAQRFQVLVWLFRTFGKTNMVTKCVPNYIMLRDPDAAVYIGSETHPKAQEVLQPLQSMLDGSDPHSRFTWLYGNWKDKERKWTRTSIIHKARRAIGVTEPSIGTFGVETGLTGKHPGVVIYDDPVSEEKLKEGGNFLRTAVDSLDSIYPALENDSLFILVGTHYREEDPIGTVLSTEGVKSWNGHKSPDKYKDGLWRVYFLQARDVSDTKVYPKGRPTAPETGWTDQNLEAYERKNAKEYSEQMMGTPGTGGHMEMEPDQIHKLKIKREELPQIEYVTIHLDTAFKSDETRSRGDRNVIGCWLHDIRPTGIVYLDRVKASAEWRSEDFDAQLVNILHHYRSEGIRVRAITDEREMGGKRGVYLRHLQDTISAANIKIPQIIQLNRAGTKKVIRIREATNFWLDGYVRILDDIENYDLLVWEMTRIGRSKHDDIADALADVWLPEIWRGRQQHGKEEQPGVPKQPGDDILKGKISQEYEDIEYELRHGRKRYNDDDDFQPWDSLMEQNDWAK